MSRALLLIGFLGFAFFAQVAAHGHMSVPLTRDYNLRQDQQNAPVTYPLYSDFVCRNYSALPSNLWTTLVAGSTSTIQWAMEAAHPGDCFAYLSYDVDILDDTKKRWFKIASFSQCNLQNVQNMTYSIPSYLPSADHAILRWEWYALHLQSINIVEFYSQCADVKIAGSPNGQLPSPQFTIPGHLPMDAKYYRPGFSSSDLTLTGPPIATIGGANYSCVSTYGQSCNVPSPTNNPCMISSQRCMSATTYQACGIGLTTTVWGPAQNCQTGLVCANNSDGVHINCVYPATTPSITPGTPAASVCTVQTMRCVSDTTYQTCTNGNSGTTLWATPQSCQTGLFCNPIGDEIFCGPNKPVSIASPNTTAAAPSPVNTTVAAPPPVNTTAAAPSPMNTTVTAPSPMNTTAPSITNTTDPTTVNIIIASPVTTSVATVDSSSGNSIPVPASPSTSCTVGDQMCTAPGSATYQTCSPNRDGSTYWAPAQSCQVGLTCHASMTANNIYCY